MMGYHWHMSQGPALRRKVKEGNNGLIRQWQTGLLRLREHIDQEKALDRTKLQLQH
jgi:hypothetical protein